MIQFEKWNDEYSKGFWIRIFGRGIKVTNSPKLFSERSGFLRCFTLPYGYKLTFLPKWNNYD